MIRSNVKPEEFSRHLKKILEEADEETVAKFNEVTKNEANTVRKDLRNESKSKFGNGSYYKGWTRKQKKQKEGYYKYIIWNKTDYRLTHLLENGHVKVLWGKRTGGFVSGKYHIRPVANSSEFRYLSAVKEALR